MPKITFRADADLVERVEALDASKSEVMREALRAYLDGGAADAPERGSLDALLDARIDERVAARFDDADDADDGDVTVNVTVNGAEASSDDPTPGRERDDVRRAGAADADGATCPQCGEALEADHAFCPNCGERAAGRPTCECGAELRSDWAFCPDCGRRTATAEVLDP